MRCLNVGSGQRRFLSTTEIEWINVDIQNRPGEEPDILAPAEHLPFDDNSIDLICSHHCYEHSGCGESKDAIMEAHRVLVPGGSLFVFVPDLKALAQAWLMGRIDEQIYMTNLYGAYRDSQADRHAWGWSQDGLIRYLFSAASWATVSQFDWRTIPGMNAARDWWVASAECRK